MPSTSASPVNEPAGHAVQEDEPDDASAIPPHAAAGTAVRNRPSASSGASTTYSPVMSPVLDTVVSWRPAVCRP